MRLWVRVALGNSENFLSKIAHYHNWIVRQCQAQRLVGHFQNKTHKTVAWEDLMRRSHGETSTAGNITRAIHPRHAPFTRDPLPLPLDYPPNDVPGIPWCCFEMSGLSQSLGKFIFDFIHLRMWIVVSSAMKSVSRLQFKATPLQPLLARITLLGLGMMETWNRFQQAKGVALISLKDATTLQESVNSDSK